MLSGILSRDKGSGDKSKKKEDGDKDEREGGKRVHTSMIFKPQEGKTQTLQSEWLLTNPGAREEKFEPWLGEVSANSGTGAVVREKMNSYNMQCLPAEGCDLKTGKRRDLRRYLPAYMIFAGSYMQSLLFNAGFFIKGNQTQTSWKRRFFCTRAGLLLFFKSDPSTQPPGVVVLPQGCVPLQGCHVALPMDFRRSFAWKRKGVSGYELKLAHRCTD